MALEHLMLLIIPIIFYIIVFGVVIYLLKLLSKMVRLKEEQNALLKEIISKLKD